jgi:uncharacterized peroxidase-related enzyme
MTTRIPPLDPKSTLGPAREIFDKLQAKVGAVPNLYRVLGQSPAALGAYVALNEALARAKLEPALREKIALAVAQRNGCGYCVSAHSFLAKRGGIDPGGITEARAGRSADPHEAAVLVLALRLVENHGRLSDAELAEARAAGLTDGELVEIVALVAANTFSNYLNLVAGTPIDFPVAPDLPVAEAA